MYKKLKYYNKHRKTIGDFAMAHIGHHRPSKNGPQYEVNDANQPPRSFCNVDVFAYSAPSTGGIIWVKFLGIQPHKVTMKYACPLRECMVTHGGCNLQVAGCRLQVTRRRLQ